MLTGFAKGYHQGMPWWWFVIKALFLVQLLLSAPKILSAVYVASKDIPALIEARLRERPDYCDTLGTFCQIDFRLMLTALFIAFLCGWVFLGIYLVLFRTSIPIWWPLVLAIFIIGILVSPFGWHSFFSDLIMGDTITFVAISYPLIIAISVLARPKSRVEEQIDKVFS